MIDVQLVFTFWQSCRHGGMGLPFSVHMGAYSAHRKCCMRGEQPSSRRGMNKFIRKHSSYGIGVQFDDFLGFSFKVGGHMVAKPCLWPILSCPSMPFNGDFFGHGLRLQVVSSRGSPTQDFPPYCGLGLSQRRLLDCLPSPHVFVQLLIVPHEPHMPSTGHGLMLQVCCSEASPTHEAPP